MQLTATKVHSSILGRNIKPIVGFDAKDYKSLEQLGIYLENSFRGGLLEMMAAMDTSQQTPITSPSVPALLQFLQAWLPGSVNILTGARKIDSLVGISTVGSIEDEQVVQTVLELDGSAVVYGDYSNVPFSSWNTQYNARTIVRFEEGMRVGFLDTLRAARIRVDNAAERRNSASLALETARNTCGFFGFNNGAGQTYGFLNDPNLLPFYTVPVGTAGFTTWSKKTMSEIIADIRTMFVNLRNQSLDQVDPEKTNTTLALPTAVVDFLTQNSDFGYSVRKWMRETYPLARVESAPQLNGANGGANVGYLYADEINDASTDGGAVWMQPVPVRFQLVGVERLAKAYIEDYANATAGVFVKRPFAVVRNSGI